MSRVVDDFVELVEVPEFEARFHLSAEAERFGTAADYRITGDAAREREFLGEVTDVGPGKPAGPDGALWIRELEGVLSPEAYAQATAQFGHRGTMPPVKRGDIAITNLNSISYRLPGGGAKHITRGDTIMATVDRETYRVGPVQSYVLVRRNDDRTQRAISKGSIWIPAGPLSTDDVRTLHKAILAEYGEVVDQGPGYWHNGQWKQPPCRPGDLVMYDCSYNVLDITVRGEKRTLVHSDQVVKIVESAIEA